MLSASSSFQGGHLRHRTIFVRLLVSAAAIIIPMLVLTGGLSWLYADAERRVLEAQRADVSARAVHIVDRKIAEKIGTLEALSAVLQNGKTTLPEFHRLAKLVADRSAEPIILFDRSGSRIVSTRTEYGQPLARLPDTGAIAPVFETKRPYVSDVFIGTAVIGPLVALSVPVMNGETVAYALSLRLSLDTLNTVLHEAGMSREWIAAIVDRNGKFVARSRNSEQFVGQLARLELVAIAAGGLSEGTFANVTLEGVAVENSFNRSTLTGWTVVMAVPTELLNRPLHRAWWTISASIVGAVALGLLLAGLSGRSIARSVRALQESALALARGEPLLWSHNSISEFNDVGKTLVQAEQIMRQRDLARAELHRTAALLETIINVTPMLIYAKDRSGRIVLSNPATLATVGKPWADIAGHAERDWHSELDEADQIAANDRQVMEGGESMQFQERFTSPSGARIFLSIKSPLRDEQGAVTGVVGVSTDITEREKRAEHVLFIMRELSHRSKNLLTVIQSIARQTIKNSDGVLDFEKNFLDRLVSLAKLHDLLIEEDWRGAALRSIIDTQISPFVADGRVQLDGPDIFLRPEVAQLFAMACHELVTNATKYGSLSNEAGQLRVMWGLGDNHGETTLFMQWQESGGPDVVPPKRRGFGSIVLQRMARRDPKTTIAYDFLPGGVVWRFEAPLDSLVGIRLSKSMVPD